MEEGCDCEKVMKEKERKIVRVIWGVIVWCWLKLVVMELQALLGTFLPRTNELLPVAQAKDGSSV